MTNYDPTKSLEFAMSKIAARTNKKKAIEVEKKIKSKIKIKINNKTTVFISKEKHKELLQQSENTGKSIPDIYNEMYNNHDNFKKVKRNREQVINYLMKKYNITEDQVKYANKKKDEEVFCNVAKFLKELKRTTEISSKDTCNRFKISYTKLNHFLYRVKT